MSLTEDSQNSGINESTQPVAPTEATDDSGEDKGHGQDALDIYTNGESLPMICSQRSKLTVLVLPNDDGVVVQVGNVGSSDTLGVLLHDHPAKVRIQQTLSDAVGILLGARRIVSSDINSTAWFDSLVPSQVSSRLAKTSQTHKIFRVGQRPGLAKK